MKRQPGFQLAQAVLSGAAGWQLAKGLAVKVHVARITQGNTSGFCTKLRQI
jgi:hypothetical protein